MQVSISDIHRKQKVSLMKGGNDKPGGFYLKVVDLNVEIQSFIVQDWGIPTFLFFGSKQFGVKPLKLFPKRHQSYDTLV